ncbi:MAG: DUF3810 domain-containing protein [Butyrivibrio sp.]|nr:DUF3810 domain-containing protein [Butyrivibrio sp.]
MKKAAKTLCTIVIFIVIFNLSAWFIPGFSDMYRLYIFPLVTIPYGKLTSLFSFSVGEILLVAAIFWIILLAIFSTSHLITFLKYKFSKSLGKKYFSFQRFIYKFARHFYLATAWVLVLVSVIMSLNCFALYHCSSVDSDMPVVDEYSLEELAALRDYVVRKCNSLSKQVSHDEKGNVIYAGDMEETAKKAIANISDMFPALAGYTVTPKALYFSDFISQQYMQGYYFPFSMEANYNNTMSIMNKPFTMCHELAHTHGYILEDEANLIGFLACIHSEDIVFQYSGYLGVLNYINNNFYKSVDKETYNSHIKITDMVKHDNEFLTDESWAYVEAKAVVKTETVKKAASVYVDTTLKANGVLEGKASYTHVVGLIMEYYKYSPELAEGPFMLTLADN